MLKKIFKQSSNYFWGEALIMASGFISFPILTRIFSKYEYGLMSLLTVTVTIIGSVSSLGANRSLVRFYHSYKEKGQIKTFFNTLIFSIFFCGIISILLATFVSRLLLTFQIISHDFFSLLPLALIWIVFQNLFIYMYTIYRLDEQIIIYNMLGITRKYAGMAIVIILVLIFRNLYSFYYGQIITEFVFVVFIFFLIHKKIGLFFKKIPSKKTFNESIKYGLPLAISTIAFKIFNLGDRYIIAHFLDVEQVATYSVGYMICDYFKQFIITPINLSLIPITFKLWEQKELEDLKSTLGMIIKYYYMIAIPIIFLVILVPKEIIILLASEKYFEATTLMPVIMSGVMLGFAFPFSAGLHLRKNTTTIFMLTSIMAIFNIILNIFFIPLFGMKGAAYATLISFLLYIFSCYQLSKNYLKFRIPFQDIIRILLLSILSFLGAYYCSTLIQLKSNIYNLLTKSTIFILLYGLLIMFFDSHMRSIILKSGKPLILAFNKKP